MKDLSNSKDFADVTLVCDDQKQIQAHRNILSACSPVFKNMLQIESHSKHSVIFLRGVQHSEMESIIQFIYLGQTTFYEDRINEFLSIAKSLQIPELDKSFDSHSQPQAEELLLAPDVNHQTRAGSKIYDLSDSSPMPIIKKPSETVSSVYNCYECGLTFDRKNSLTLHKNEYHQMNEVIKFPCNQCNQQYTQESNLKAHIRYAHAQACSVCGRKFARKDALKHHIESMHNVKFL